LAQVIGKKFFQPLAYNRLFDVLDGHLATLQELEITLSRANRGWPVNELYAHPTLSPRIESAYVRDKMSEDHFYDGSRHPEPPSFPRTRGATQRFEVKCGSSTYRDMYSLESRCGAEAKIAKPIRPVENGRSFGLYPEVNLRSRNEVSDLLLKQSFTDRKTGKAYRAIFESATCL
jgi:hypothetical protein